MIPPGMRTSGSGSMSSQRSTKKQPWVEGTLTDEWRASRLLVGPRLGSQSGHNNLQRLRAHECRR